MDEFEQIPLYDDHEIGAFRWDNPDTSIEAAKSIDATKLQGMVRDVVWQRRELGATYSEAAAILGLPRDTVSPRGAPLQRKGLIVDSGERRPGPSNRKQIVWVAPQFAKAAVVVETDPPLYLDPVEAMVSL